MHLTALHPGKNFTQNEFLKETSHKKILPTDVNKMSMASPHWGICGNPKFLVQVLVLSNYPLDSFSTAKVFTSTMLFHWQSEHAINEYGNTTLK